MDTHGSKACDGTVRTGKSPLNVIFVGTAVLRQVSPWYIESAQAAIAMHA